VELGPYAREIVPELIPPDETLSVYGEATDGDPDEGLPTAIYRIP